MSEQLDKILWGYLPDSTKAVQAYANVGEIVALSFQEFFNLSDYILASSEVGVLSRDYEVLLFMYMIIQTVRCWIMLAMLRNE